MSQSFSCDVMACGVAASHEVFDLTGRDDRVSFNPDRTDLKPKRYCAAHLPRLADLPAAYCVRYTPDVERALLARLRDGGGAR